jgi:hypothetical protein
MALSRKAKISLIVGPIVLLALVVLSQLGRVWWYSAYSEGTRTGVIRKISIKGPPYCKYLSAEMVLQSAIPGQPAEVWEFSVDEDDETSPLVMALHETEKKGERVTVRYRQDLGSLYRCTPSEYFVTAIEK